MWLITTTMAKCSQLDFYILLYIDPNALRVTGLKENQEMWLQSYTVISVGATYWHSYDTSSAKSMAKCSTHRFNNCATLLTDYYNYFSLPVTIIKLNIIGYKCSHEKSLK